MHDIKNDYGFRTFIMALAVPKPGNEKEEYIPVMFGRVVVDLFECTEHGPFKNYHHYVDKEDIENACDLIRDSYGVKDTPYDVVVIIPYGSREYRFPFGRYYMAKEGYNYEVNWDEDVWEGTKGLIEDLVDENVEMD